MRSSPTPSGTVIESCATRSTVTDDDALRLTGIEMTSTPVANQPERPAAAKEGNSRSGARAGRALEASRPSVHTGSARRTGRDARNGGGS